MTGSGVSILVTERFAEAGATTAVDALPLSSPATASGVAAVMVAVLVRTVAGAATTFATTMKVAAPMGNDAIVHVTVPFVPTVGPEQFQPAVPETETNVVPAGSGSLSCTEAAVLGPEFVTLIV
jgi:hypothetical protein